MQPAETQKDVSETTVPGVPQGRQQRQEHQRLEIDNRRRMKADRLKLADVLQLVGIRYVLDDVLVQAPTVRVNKGRSKADNSGYEPGFGGTEVPGAPLGNRFDRGVQQIRTDIAGEHQKDNEEATMQICPKQREWNQPREQLCAEIGRA